MAVAPSLSLNSTQIQSRSSRHLTRGCFKMPGSRQHSTRRCKIPGKGRILPKTVPCTFCPVLAACPSPPVRPVLAKCPPPAVDGIVVDGSGSRDLESTTIRFSDTPLTSLSIFSALRDRPQELFQLCESGVHFFAPFDREQRNLQLGARPEHGRGEPIALQLFRHVTGNSQYRHSLWGSQRTRPIVVGRATAADWAALGREGSPGRFGRLLNHVQEQLLEETREGAAGGWGRKAKAIVFSRAV